MERALEQVQEVLFVRQDDCMGAESEGGGDTQGIGNSQGKTFETEPFLYPCFPFSTSDVRFKTSCVVFIFCLL